MTGRRRRTARTGPRLVGLVGIVWGCALLARPDALWTSVAGRRPDDDEVLVTRVLGTRHLVQGVAQMAAPRLTRRPAVVVDVTHAASMLALAVRSPAHARPALASGGVAVVAAVVSWAAGRRT